MAPTSGRRDERKISVHFHSLLTSVFEIPSRILSEEEEDSSIGFGGRGQTKGKLSQEKEGKKQPRKIFERFNKDSKTPGSGDLGEWEKHTKGIGAKLLFQV